MKFEITNNRFNAGDFFDVRHNGIVIFSSTMFECRMYVLTRDDDAAKSTNGAMRDFFTYADDDE